MVKYCRQPKNPDNTCKAMGSDLRVHFKNTRELVKNVSGMKLKQAQKYLDDIDAHKRIVPFRRFRYGVGRHAQCKEWGVTEGRWPAKSVAYVRSLLKNAESNAELKGLTGTLFISHIKAAKAQRQRRRTYRAHGRINPYMSSPTHLEVILTQKTEAVKPPSS
eukprot:NODE_2306_length_600_cov_238.137421_g2256_i0.p1 GENE.NODE_2306_length_600_cov_238.137421_g2256_i0~~NODE_2306_length_600_cov_238.137421_g2256_i0.p1  ORF type:complete len:162 (+),score=27.12 NODE_2306_length_600_cov_238.137421_g2256_i0:79-564(+)